MKLPLDPEASAMWDFMVSWAPSKFLSAAITVAPSRDSTWHAARPIPEPAPKIKAVSKLYIDLS